MPKAKGTKSKLTGGGKESNPAASELEELKKFEVTFGKTLQETAPDDEEFRVKMMDVVMGRSPDFRSFVTRDTAERSQSTSEKTSSTSISAKKREQKKRREERKKNEEIAGTSNENAVNLQRAMLPGNLRLNLRNMETLMMEKPMEVLKYLEERINEMKNKRPCKVKDHTQFVDVLNALDPKSAYYQRIRLNLACSVYLLLETAIDLPFESPYGDSENFDDDDCTECFGLANIPDLKHFLRCIAKNSAFDIANKMKDLMKAELADSVLKQYLTTEDYEEYLHGLDTVSCRYEGVVFKCAYPKNADEEMQALGMISEVYIMFGGILTQAKAQYFRTDKSRGPFKISELPDSFQIKWLIEENPMNIFKTFENWVNQELVDRDYSNEDESYKQDAKRCLDYRTECLEYADQENWDEFSSEQQEKVRTFVRFVYGFLRRNETILKAKSIAGNENEEYKESSMSEVSTENAVNHRRAMLPGNLAFNLSNVETLMVEKPMEVMKYLEERITEKKNKGSCKVKDAFLRMLSKYHAIYVNIVKGLHLKSATHQQHLLRLSRYVYFSLKTTIDLPYDTPSDGNAYFHADECIDWSGLDEIPDLISFVGFVANSSSAFYMIKKMKDLMKEEQADSDLKKYLTIQDEKEYQNELKVPLERYEEDVLKKFNSKKADVELYTWITEVYHLFGVALTQAKAQYFRTDKSKGPFRIKDLPDTFQIKWLIEENPMKIFKTFEKWVNQKLVIHDYINEDEDYIGDAKKCKDFLTQCLKFPDQENWEEFSSEQQEKVRILVRFVHHFLVRYHSEIFSSSPDIYLNANKSPKAKRRVQLHEIELDEYIESDAVNETSKKTEQTISTVSEESKPMDSELDTTESTPSTSGETPFKSISAKKREQKRRREERKRNEASSEAKSTAGNGNEVEKEVDKESSKSEVPNENAVNLQRAMLPGNLKLNLSNVETLMLEKPMEVLEYLEERIAEKKNEGSCKVKDAFLKTLSKWHTHYVCVVKLFNYKLPTAQQTVLDLSPSVYFSLKTAMDLPFETPFDAKRDFDDHNCIEFFKYDEFPDSECYVLDFAIYPIYMLKKTNNLLKEEQKNSPLKEYLTSEDYERYQEELRELSYRLQADPSKYSGPQKYIVKMQILDWISEAYHMFGVYRTRAKAKYLQTDKSKGPFKIRELPGSLEIKWLLEENPMNIFKTFEKWVTQKLVNHDYSNEEIWYKQSANICKDFLMECLEYADQENWDEFSSEQQEKVRKFVQFVHGFLELNHFEIFECQTDSYYNDDDISPNSKLRVQLSEIELDEYMVSTSGDKKTTSMTTPKKTIAGGNLKKSDSNLKSGLKTSDDHHNPNDIDKPKSQKSTSQKTEQSISTRVPEELAKIVNENLKRMGSMSKKDKGKSKTENGCQNEKCMDLKKLYRQEQNNRTIAEGELKRAAHKIKGYDILKKEEENWKVEKKRMEKEMRRLRESKDNEIKELKEEIEKLKESNKSMEEHRKNTFELYLETKKSLQETTRSFESLRDSTIIINMETKRVLDENRQLNGPYTLKYSSPEHKLKVFKELKEKFNPAEIIEKVNTMAEIFPEKSTEFEDALKTEQERVETSSEIYTRILEYNLKLIEDTNSTTGLLPVPFPPTVSEQFEKIFKKGLEKLEGKECYVCLQRLEIGEKIYACADFYKHIVCFECGNNMIVQWKGKCGFCPGVLNESTYDVSMDE